MDKKKTSLNISGNLKKNPAYQKKAYAGKWL